MSDIIILANDFLEVFDVVLISRVLFFWQNCVIS